MYKHMRSTGRKCDKACTHSNFNATCFTMKQFGY